MNRHSSSSNDFRFPTSAKHPVSLFKTIKEADARRRNLPGEHLLVFGAGLLLMTVAGRKASPLQKMLFGALGTALMGRAASGTGGIAKIAKWLR